MRALTFAVITVFAGVVTAILASTPMTGVDRAVVIELAAAIAALAVIVTVNSARIARG